MKKIFAILMMILLTALPAYAVTLTGGGSGGGTGDVSTDAIWDAAGDLAYGTGNDTASKLAIGTAGQVLKVNSGATAPEWTSSLSVTIDDSAAQFVGVTTDHTGKAKIDLTTSTPTKTTTLKLANADDATITFPSVTSTLVAETVATGGVILGDTSPDAAGELGYASTQLIFHDGTAARNVAKAGTLTNTKWCSSDGTVINCTENPGAGTGDLLADGSVAWTGAPVPNAANTLALGSATAEWADIFLGDGAVIYGQNDQSNTLTSAATGWTVALDLTVTGGKITFGNAETIDNETDGEVKVVSPVTKMMYDADAYMSVTIANGGGATIGVTSDGADTISIGDNTDDQVRVRHVLSTTDGTWSGNSLYFAQCAASLAFGTPVYVQSTGKPAAANAAAAATMPAIGVIVVASTDADTPCTVLTHGVISADAYPTFTAGNTVYVDDSAAGVLTATVGDISGTDHVVQVVGIALNSDEILVMPSLSVVTLE